MIAEWVERPSSGLGDWGILLLVSQCPELTTDGHTIKQVSHSPKVRKWSEKNVVKHQDIRDHIISHHMNPGCISPALASISGDIRKSLACQQIPGGAADGTHPCVHWGSTSGQCDASIRENFGMPKYSWRSCRRDIFVCPSRINFSTVWGLHKTIRCMVVEHNLCMHTSTLNKCKR